MKILIYGINFDPELIGVGKYTTEMAEFLALKHEVRVVAAIPYYPAWKPGQGYSSWRYRSRAHKGIKVIHCPLWVPGTLSGFNRIIHLFSFALSSFWVVLFQGIFWRPEAVLTVAPSMSCALGGWLAARLAGACAWLHFQDLELDVAEAIGLVRNKALLKAAHFVERLLIALFDVVSAISPAMCGRVAAKGVSAQKTVLFPNCVDTRAIYPLPDPQSCRGAMGIPDGKIVALYSGNLGGKQGLDIMPKAAVLLRDRPDILFVICGEGGYRGTLECASAGLGNVVFMNLQPAGRLNILLNAAHIHLLPQRNEVADYVMPSKLFGMLASGRPVVAVAAPGSTVGDIVDQCGVLVAPGDVRAFAQAVQDLADDEQRRGRMGDSGRALAQEMFESGSVLGQFEQKLSERCQPLCR